MTPLISVLLPVYNGQKFIEETILSVLSQTFTNFELLILDDGSTDNTLQIVQSIADHRINLIQNQHIGRSEQLNIGLTMAKGAYIARIDADDICMPTRFEKQAAYLGANPAVILCGAWIELFGAVSQTIKHPVSSSDIKSHLLFKSVLAHPAVMFRKTCLQNLMKVYRKEFEQAEDYDLWERLINLGDFYNIPEVLLRYRTHSGQVSYQKTENTNTAKESIHQRFLDKLLIKPTKQESFIHRQLGDAMYHLIPNARAVENWLSELLEANNRTSTFEQLYYNDMLGKIWFEYSLLHTAIPIKGWFVFFGSPLRKLYALNAPNVVGFYFTTLRRLFNFVKKKFNI